MALRQSLSQKLTQKLSPQQIQLMKLLQVPTLEIDQRIKQELEINPALEEGKDELENEFDQEDYQTEADGEERDFDIEEYFSDDEPAYKTSVSIEAGTMKIKVFPFLQEKLSKNI